MVHGISPLQKTASLFWLSAKAADIWLGKAAPQPYAAGECYLIPSNLGRYTIEGHSTVLRSYLP